MQLALVIVLHYDDELHVAFAKACAGRVSSLQ